MQSRRLRYSRGKITWGEFSRRYRGESFEAGSVDRRCQRVKNRGQKYTLRLLNLLAGRIPVNDYLPLRRGSGGVTRARGDELLGADPRHLRPNPVQKAALILLALKFGFRNDYRLRIVRLPAAEANHEKAASSKEQSRLGFGPNGCTLYGVTRVTLSVGQIRGPSWAEPARTCGKSVHWRVSRARYRVVAMTKLEGDRTRHRGPKLTAGRAVEPAGLESWTHTNLQPQRTTWAAMVSIYSMRTDRQ